MASETIQIKKLSEYTEVTFSGGKYPIEIEANKGMGALRNVDVAGATADASRLVEIVYLMKE